MKSIMRIITKSKLLLVAICLLANAIDLLAITSPDAQTKNEKPIHFFLGIGLTFGGDKMATLFYEGGGKSNVRAGAVAELKGGINYRIIRSVSLRGSFGYHFDQESSGSDGNINFKRFPLEGMVLVHINDELNVGAGLRKAFWATLEGTKELAYFGSYTLDSSLGIVLEAGYKVASWGFALRYVSEKYRLNAYSAWINGGHVGLGVNYYFK